jgi:hypothetical protein
MDGLEGEAMADEKLIPTLTLANGVENASSWPRYVTDGR